MWKLLNTNLSDIKRIQKHGLRPDYQGESQFKQLIICEGKGSSSSTTLDKLIRHGINQKISFTNAHFSAVSGIHLRQDNCSTLKIIDPNGIPKERTWAEKATTKAEYYSHVFSFLGLKELSKYFGLMIKRINKLDEREWFDEKRRLFEIIPNEYTVMRYQGDKYFGSYTTDLEGNSIFAGIRKQAIYFKDFIYNNDRDESNSLFDTENGNSFFQPEKNIMISSFVEPGKYISSYKKTSLIRPIKISDLHYSKELVAINLLKKFLMTHGADPDEKILNGFDISFKFGKVHCGVYFKRFYFSNKKAIYIQLKKYMDNIKPLKNIKQILITPSYLEKTNYSDYANSITIIAGRDLNKLLHRKVRLDDFF